MAGFTRCTVCKGFITHSFIADDGVNVYRCTREDSFNDVGRYFIQTGSAGLIQVVPNSKTSYEILDLERELMMAKSKEINEELESRRQMFLKSRELAGFKKGEEDENLSNNSS